MTHTERLLSAQKAVWTPTEILLPVCETPVLVVVRGVVRIGERCWDHPGHEDTYQSYWYWDDPHNQGQEWERDHVTHWMPIPTMKEQP